MPLLRLVTVNLFCSIASPAWRLAATVDPALLGGAFEFGSDVSASRVSSASTCCSMQKEL
eukprot:4003368-Amphidinium_carterae.1